MALKVRIFICFLGKSTTETSQSPMRQAAMLKKRAAARVTTPLHLQQHRDHPCMHSNTGEEYVKQGSFSAHEDAVIRSLVAVHPPQTTSNVWARIARMLPGGRCGKQCRDRCGCLINLSCSAGRHSIPFAQVAASSQRCR